MYYKRAIISINLLMMEITLFSHSNYNLFQQDQNSLDSLINSTYKSTQKPYPENRVHRAGLFWMNISNCGYVGNISSEEDPVFDPCTGKPAVSGEMPGDSGQGYLFAASLMLGGYLDSASISIDGTNMKVFQGPLVSTAWEGSTTIYGAEIKPYFLDEDLSGITRGRIYESSCVEGRMNCLFQDVYDPKATAYEQFTTRFSDKGTDHYTWDQFDSRSHIPLGIEIKQTSYAWPYDYAKKFIIIDYTVYNLNNEKKDIYDFFIGLHTDCDIKNTNFSKYGHMDDICGFIEKWDSYIDPATGDKKSVELNLIWSADNDGRSYEYSDEIGWEIAREPSAGAPLYGATGNFSVMVLRNPNPNSRYSFNISSLGSFESEDWGPHWKTGLHSDWQYDLTPKQKGYDDTNYDNLYWFYEPLFGGRTEGTPVGDKGRYMVMSNDEFDHNLTSIREIYLGMDTQTDSTPIPQADKWQPWVVTGTEQAGGISDGTLKELNDLANGSEQRFLLSFGPLGYEKYENVAIDIDGDSLGIPDDFINKKVWKFAYGDSLKLTLAFMVSENFHTSLDQDPNYADSTIVDLTDGLDVSLFDQGWYDAFNNVVWAERVFDTPMYDTPVKRWGTSKKDGWYGEDVGADGMFGDLINDTYCWWMDKNYPGPDDGEN
ncbi:TPA: hypothetical protein DCR49_10045, partial [Candidatus Delongbacteria bacterium]|nr:hypothetical protein [Candidatus Delongbacteria bacterium]